ncbi:MAG: hypothetical protein RMJ82_07890 [Gemmatales bacterium]|nr:hypothetical protein [Gemmatales bacterium]
MRAIWKPEQGRMGEVPKVLPLELWLQLGPSLEQRYVSRRDTELVT